MNVASLTDSQHRDASPESYMATTYSGVSPIAQDRTGRSWSSYWKTKLSHFTEMEFPGTTKVRVLHRGKLSESERVGLRRDIVDSQWHISAALKLVSECRRDIERGIDPRPHKIELVKETFGHDADRHLGLIEERLQRIDRGLKSNIEISLHNRIPLNEKKSSVLSKNDDRLLYQGVADTGSHSVKRNIRFSLNRLTNKEGRYGGQVITNLVAINSAGLSNNGHTPNNIRSSGINGIDQLSRRKDHTSYNDAASYAKLGYAAAQHEREIERLRSSRPNPRTGRGVSDGRMERTERFSTIAVVDGEIRGHATHSNLEALVRRDRNEGRSSGSQSSIAASVGRNLDVRRRPGRGERVR